MAEEYRTTGRGLPHCTDDVAVVRYENGEVSGGLYVEVLNPELNSQLAERFTREIQHGTGPRIDLHRIAMALEIVSSLTRAAGAARTTRPTVISSGPANRVLA